MTLFPCMPLGPSHDLMTYTAVKPGLILDEKFPSSLQKEDQIKRTLESRKGNLIGRTFRAMKDISI